MPIARVKKRAPTAADIRLIEQHAAAKDPRAVEVLAWCKLTGIGMAADLVDAYWLYARGGRSRRRQRAQEPDRDLSRRRLTSEQRQQVLIKEKTAEPAMALSSAPMMADCAGET